MCDGVILFELCDLLSQPSLNSRVKPFPGVTFSSDTGILILRLQREEHQRIRTGLL